MKTVLFICVENSCRSQMSEEGFNRLVEIPIGTQEGIRELAATSNQVI